MTARLQTHDFDVSKEIHAMGSRNDEVGGIATFVGRVRKHDGHREIIDLNLEHYPGMTEKQLAILESEAQKQWPIDQSLIIHRYGRLRPGDQIVLVATAATHRQAALEACAFLIEQLKTRATFWKEENTSEGRRWVEPFS